MRRAALAIILSLVAGCGGIFGEGRLPGQVGNNLRQLSITVHNYHDLNGSFPPSAIVSKNGRPLLSWRVALLPYLGMDDLYGEFKLDEPWDSPHNMKLLSRMPDIYRARKTIPSDPNSTYLRAIVGPSTVFGQIGEEPKSFSDIKAGMDKTLLIAEAAEAVPWTKPDELRYDPSGPPPQLGGEKLSKGAWVLFTSGIARQVPKGADGANLMPLMTIEGPRDVPEWAK